MHALRAMRVAPAALFVITLLAAGCDSPTTEPKPEPRAGPVLVPTPAAPPEVPGPRAAAPEPPNVAKPIVAPEDVAAPPKDAQQTKTGLFTKVLDKGTGKARPKPTDRVKVNYTGWTADGKMFDSSVARGEPAVFSVDQVIAGWTEALQLMVAGEKRRLWIPAKLAYGDRPQMGAPSGQLTFDVELLEILAAPKPIAAPRDVAKAPATAKKTASGLAYKLLTKGKGKTHPKPTDRVTVHYTGWTTDGKMFDSSVMREEPATFPLDRVIKGWTEGVPLMVVGDKMRFWIPAELAYGDKPKRPGAPSGPLTFDVELLNIQ
jgi:FKBP-type peptidyl-prolyl cis-trans isomerase